MRPVTGERTVYVPTGRAGEFRLIPCPEVSAHPHAAITDWLNFTFPFEGTKAEVEALLRGLYAVLGRKFFPALERPMGKYNYKRSIALGETRALIAFGGNGDTALVTLPGEECALIRDWAALAAFARNELHARITRWDGAVDDYLGEHSVEEAIRLYEQGLFSAGGRPPKPNQHGNWLCPAGAGRTLEIGKREHGKRLCVYEKGMQLGALWHPWVRWELTLGNKDRVIPWEVLLEPGRYVAGAYPKALGWVTQEMSRIRTLQKQTQIGYETAVKNALHQVGTLVNLMMQVEPSAEAVVEKLRREGTPRRVQHPAVENPEGWIE